MKRCAVVCAAALLSLQVAAAAPSQLPIYIEDSHAGSFYWLAQHLDLEKPCTLLHFDAHSDASAVFDSDNIRIALRHVTSPEGRQQLLDQWRRQGAIQCFGWIEPLMPAPIADVIWIPAETLQDARKAQQTAAAAAQIDGHLEAAPRKAGSFRTNYRVCSLEHLEENPTPTRPLIVTIDLDYFAGRPAAEQAIAFAHVWKVVMRQPALRAVTFAISRPYLQSDEEADRLLRLALHAALSLPTARVQFEPFRTVENDQSNRARELHASGQPVPSFDITKASEELRATILAQKDRIHLEYDRSRWETLVQQWNDIAPRLHLEVKDAQPSTDKVWRIRSTQPATVKLLVEPWMSRLEHVEWFALVPGSKCCNVSDLGPAQVGFVSGAAPRPTWIEQPIVCSDNELPISRLDSLFAEPNRCGSIRLFARATVDGRARETAAIDIRRYAGTGFRAAISEQFGLPYLFGSGQLWDGTDSGPEMNLGADCANFLVFALRRQGLQIPWADPKELRTHLHLIAASIEPGITHVTDDDLEQGLIVHLRSHVAAVMEDCPPVGILDANDLVAHQLKGEPEILTLGELLHQRNRTSFDLLRVRPPVDQDETLLFGGDIMLGRTCADKIARGIDPFAGIRDLLRRSAFAAANLECTISQQGDASSTARYSFRAPARSATLLHQAGFRAVGLANNHALDFGRDALRRCAQILTQEKIEPVGVITTDDAYAPKIFELPGNKKLALLAITDLPEGQDSSVANACNRVRLGSAIEGARTKANIVACLVHWGAENTSFVTDKQRDLARWLIDQGVNVVVGTHPHCLQPLDFYHGRPIAYSLGNLVFDGAPGVPSWNHGALLQIRLSRDAKIQSAELIPVTLQDGLPRTAPRVVAK